MVTLSGVQKYANETKSYSCTVHLYAKQDKQEYFHQILKWLEANIKSKTSNKTLCLAGIIDCCCIESFNLHHMTELIHAWKV